MILRLWGGLAVTVMTLFCSPRGRSSNGRGAEGSGLSPELAASRISEGNSPNVQAEVGRLVGQLTIEAAHAELGRRGLTLDEKAVRRIANELGTQMLATRTRDLIRAAVLSGRWEEIVARTREAMAWDRGKSWRWTPPDCL